MKSCRCPSLLMVLMAMGAHAQVPIQHPKLEGPFPVYPTVVCWYNEQKQLTGSDVSPRSNLSQFILKTGRRGDYAWAFGVTGPDGRGCPARLTDVPYSAPPKLLTCWYDEQKRLSGAEEAAPGAPAFQVINSGRGGDRAWSYVKPDGRYDHIACPGNVPTP